jgi:hypothetical protein
MKIKILSFLLIVMTGLMLPMQTNAQEEVEEQRSFVVILDFMKSNFGQEALKMEKEIFLPIHQHQVDYKKKIAWFCFEVLFPNGRDIEYNYVTVNVYGSGKDYFSQDGESWAEAFAYTHPGENIDEVMRDMTKSRDWVRTELFSFIDEAVPGTKPTMSEYIHVNFMKTPNGKEEEYVKMEREIFKPIHAADVASGGREDWALYSRMAPYGSQFDYNFITVDMHGNLDQLMSTQSEALWKQVHPDKNIEDLFDKMVNLRSLVRQETWKLVAQTNYK